MCRRIVLESESARSQTSRQVLGQTRVSDDGNRERRQRSFALAIKSVKFQKIRMLIHYSVYHPRPIRAELN
jgi:hypothetical protein